MITGTDETSIKVLESYEVGNDIKHAVSVFGVTLDQAKKLARFHHLIKLAKTHLDCANFERLKELGLKILVLANMFKLNDWEGITEVLSSVDANIKRDNLAKYPALIAEKRERIAENREKIERSIARLETQQHKVQQKITDAEENYADMQSNLALIKMYPKNVVEFLSAHVGLANSKTCLTKRVYQDWHKKLKKDGFIVFDEDDYIYYIPDLNRLADEVLRRYKAKGKLEFDSDKDEWGVSADYRNKGIVRVSDNLIKQAENLKQEIKKLEKEKKQCEKEIKELRHIKPESFIEAVSVANQLSKRELQAHGELQDFGLRWLYQKGYACVTELTTTNRRFDVIGFDEQQRIIILEAKASIEDFRRDTKWNEYLKYCNEFYFVFEESSYYRYQEDIDSVIGDAGVIIKGSYEIIKQCSLSASIDDVVKKSLIFSISQTLSKKFIFGY